MSETPQFVACTPSAILAAAVDVYPSTESTNPHPGYAVAAVESRLDKTTPPPVRDAAGRVANETVHLVLDILGAQFKGAEPGVGAIALELAADVARAREIAVTLLRQRPAEIGQRLGHPVEATAAGVLAAAAAAFGSITIPCDPLHGIREVDRQCLDRSTPEAEMAADEATRGASRAVQIALGIMNASDHAQHPGIGPLALYLAGKVVAARTLAAPILERAAERDAVDAGGRGQEGIL